jgi:hypothetical protein
VKCRHADRNDKDMNRRRFLHSVGASALLADQSLLSRTMRDVSGEIVDYKKPVFNFHQFFSEPVKIESIDLLQAQNQYFLRTRSTDGAEGLIQTKDIADYVPILAHRVRRHFLGKDARDLENLIDEVYAANSNYKLAGQAFWCPVAYIEQSLLDLMGKSCPTQ